MSFSLSSVDAQLEELCPTELAALIAGLSFPPLTLPLAQVDALLAALAEPGSASAASAGDFSRRRRSAPANDVGPLPPRKPSVLPERSSLPSLPRASVPNIARGSLPSISTPLPPTRRDLSPVRTAARQSAAAAPHDDAEFEGSFVRATETAAEAPAPKLAAPKPHASALRDADAEFDALLADATSPQGLPVRKLLDTPASDTLGDAQRMAPGVDADVLDAVVGQDSSSFALPPASDETGIDVPIDGDDATDVFDQQTFEAIQARSLPPPAAEEEVDLSEFELEFDAMIESDTEQGVHVPPPVPAAPRGAASAEQAPAADKRPSFLGRLFNRRDGESE